MTGFIIFYKLHVFIQLSSSLAASLGFLYIKLSSCLGLVILNIVVKWFNCSLLLCPSFSLPPPPSFPLGEIDFWKNSTWGEWVIFLCMLNLGEIFALGSINKNVLIHFFEFFPVKRHKFQFFPQSWWDMQVWEKANQKLWREIKPSGIYRNMRGCILEVNPEGLVWYVGLPFCLFWPGDWNILWKRGRCRIKSVLILK